jgi:hypothetical protein
MTGVVLLQLRERFGMGHFDASKLNQLMQNLNIVYLNSPIYCLFADQAGAQGHRQGRHQDEERRLPC